jgi:hypothetical protein
MCQIFSQVPQMLKYQAVLRDVSGNPLVSINKNIIVDILQGSTSGINVFSETQNVSTNELGIVNLDIGSVNSAGFVTIDWSKGPYFLKVMVDGQVMGTSQLLSVPFALYADKTGRSDKLEVNESPTLSADSALFIVRDKLGQPVFAVYETGVQITYDVNPLTKGARGGFTVGGRTTSKGSLLNIMNVTTDSVRIYVDTASFKGARGGFTVGGRTQSKGLPGDIFSVYTAQSNGSFGINSGQSTEIVNPGRPAILWYPLRNSLLAGQVLIESPDSVGTNSFASGFESKSIGNYSQALGYQAIARGNYSTSIGFQSVANNDNSFAFGQWAMAKNQESYAFGRGAIASGFRSFAFGSAGVDSAGNTTGVAYAKGDYSFAIGQGSQSLGTGAFTIGLGNNAVGNYSVAIGYQTNARGWFSTAIGSNSSAIGVESTAMGYLTRASGFESTAIGFADIASGEYSTALGFRCTAQSYHSTAIGSYNVVSGDSLNWNWTDPIFVIGNGQSIPLRNNALTVLKNGCIGLQYVTSPTYALQLLNSSAIGLGQAIAYQWNTYSDGRIKTNRKSIPYGLNEVLQLNPQFYFQHNSTSDNCRINIETIGKDDIGLIAQDVFKIIPEVVSKPANEEKELWSISYEKLIPVLIKAIQEQQEMIQNLQNTSEAKQVEIDKLIASLSKVNKLQTEVEQLKSLIQSTATK